MRPVERSPILAGATPEIGRLSRGRVRARIIDVGRPQVAGRQAMGGAEPIETPVRKTVYWGTCRKHSLYLHSPISAAQLHNRRGKEGGRNRVACINAIEGNALTQRAGE